MIEKGRFMMALLKALGSLVIVSTSFFVTLWLLDDTPDLHSPLLGVKVSYNITAEEQPEVCAAAKSVIQFEGQICKVNGARVSVLWSSLANTTNRQPSCGPEKLVRWGRKEGDEAYNRRFLGSCGARPDFFATMPAEFDPKVLRMDQPK